MQLCVETVRQTRGGLISDNSSVRHSSVERDDDDDDVQLVEVFFLPFSSTHFLPFLEQIQTHSSWKTVGLLKKQKKNRCGSWVNVYNYLKVLMRNTGTVLFYILQHLPDELNNKKKIYKRGREGEK